MKYEHFIEEWKKLYEEGQLSFREIGKRYAIEPSTVTRTLKKHVNIRPKSKWSSKSKEWLALYQDGYTKTEIASKYGTTVSQVSKILQKEGIYSEETGNKQKYAHLTEEFIRLYQEGLSLSDISVQLGVSKQTVSNYLERNEVDRRSLSESIGYLHVEEDYFDTVDNPTKAFHLGLLFAEGTLLVRPNAYITQLSFAKDKKEAMEPLVYALRGKFEGFYETNDDVYVFRFHSEHLYKSLKKIGLSSKDETVFPNLPKSLLSAFFKGLFAGRMLSSEKGHFYFSANEGFAESVKEILVKELKIEPSAIKMKHLYASRKQLGIYRKSVIQQIADWTEELFSDK